MNGTSPPWPRFILDGKIVEACEAKPTTTLLQYLRGPLRRTGTKEGCAEGDCGACTVVIGRREGEAIRYRAVNSCIRFVGTVDGCEVVTVESLRAPNGDLHPVQRAMVECDASQCGFCTPGFVMSLFAQYLEAGIATRANALEALSGNLCRCTGYRPIVDAALRMEKYPEPHYWSRADAQARPRFERLLSIARPQGEPLRAEVSGRFDAPRTVDELSALYEANPDAVLLAGGTDVGLWVTKHLRELPHVIYLGEVTGLDTMFEREGTLEIGATVDLQRAFRELVTRYPAIAGMARRFASIPIRNCGTLCGNVANGSPVGDSMPVLIVLGANVVLRKGARTRTLPLEDLYVDYHRNALDRGEWVAAVHVPRVAATGMLVETYKVSKRFDQDISAVCGAYAIARDGNRIATARIAYGGMAATPKRAFNTEVALTGQPWSLETFEDAIPALAHDYRPIGDMRASAEYRLLVAGNLLRRFYLAHETDAGPRVPLSVSETVGT